MGPHGSSSPHSEYTSVCVHANTHSSRQNVTLVAGEWAFLWELAFFCFNIDAVYVSELSLPTASEQLNCVPV